MPYTSTGPSNVRFAASFAFLFFLCAVTLNAQTKPVSAASRIYAQKVLEETLAAHPELAGLELSATPPGKKQCATIASGEVKDIGEKCGKDEFIAMITNRPFVQKEKENGHRIYDVTVPIHDARGKMVATIGIDFKSEPNQSETQIAQRSVQIANELEAKISSKAKLFGPVD